MNQERFKAEILPLRQSLFHIAQKILVEEEEAEDAVQEVLLKLWRTRDSLDKYDSLAACFASRPLTIRSASIAPALAAFAAIP